MNDSSGYAVFFFPQALEALGEAIQPYLQEGAAGAHVVCHEIDTGGALVEMTLHGQDSQGRGVELELMVPTSMVRMIVSARSDEAFGFGPPSSDPSPTRGPHTACRTPARSGPCASTSSSTRACTEAAARARTGPD